MIYRHFSLFIFHRLPLGFLLFLLFAGSSCKRKPADTIDIVEKSEPQTIQNESPFPIDYATGFDIERKSDYFLLHISRGNNQLPDRQTYILIRKGTPLPSNPERYQIINIPVKKVVLLQTAYVAYFNFCNANQAISGIADAQYVFDEKISERIRTGKITPIGPPEQVNTELIVQMNPDLVIGSGFPDAPDKMVSQLEQMGLPVLMMTDWLEANPLGRAEWAKLIGFLTGTEKPAVEKFKTIDARYRQLCEKAKLTTTRPEVICNLPYKGTWYLPGGNSYIANLLRDARASYGWYNDLNRGGIRVDFESVFLAGLKADIWINPGSATSLEGITGVDPRLSNFKPVKTGRVFNRNKRVHPNGANDYWESGLVNPHLLLADIISILHPEVLPGHELFYYQKLR